MTIQYGQVGVQNKFQKPKRMDVRDNFKSKTQRPDPSKSKAKPARGSLSRGRNNSSNRAQNEPDINSKESEYAPVDQREEGLDEGIISNQFSFKHMTKAKQSSQILKRQKHKISINQTNFSHQKRLLMTTSYGVPNSKPSQNSPSL